MGAMVDKKMNLGILTRGMCNTIIKIAKNITSEFMHSSFGREFTDNKDSTTNKGNEGKYASESEMPHLALPFWDGLDNLIISKEGEDVPELGGVMKEDPDTKLKRKKTNPAQPPDIDLDATYTLSFKTSNLDLRTWSITSIPLLAGTDLHTFWGDGSMRISAWLVPSPKGLFQQGCKGEAGTVVSVTDVDTGKEISLPKYHVNNYLKYIFNVEIVHVTNIPTDAKEMEKAAPLLLAMHDLPLPALNTLNSSINKVKIKGSDENADVTVRASTSGSSPKKGKTRERRRSASNFVSYTTNIYESTESTHTGESGSPDVNSVKSGADGAGETNARAVSEQQQSNNNNNNNNNNNKNNENNNNRARTRSYSEDFNFEDCYDEFPPSLTNYNSTGTGTCSSGGISRVESGVSMSVEGEGDSDGEGGSSGDSDQEQGTIQSNGNAVPESESEKEKEERERDIIWPREGERGEEEERRK